MLKIMDFVFLIFEILILYKKNFEYQLILKVYFFFNYNFFKFSLSHVPKTSHHHRHTTNARHFYSKYPHVVFYQ